MQWLPRADVMTFEEIERLARVFVERYGVESIRLTGGEPTVRAHLPVLVAKLAALRTAEGPVDLAMTTNGATMRLVAGALREAGLRRVNISLDTLDKAKFAEMTRRDELATCSTGSPPHRRPGSIRSRSTPSSSAGSTTTRSSISPRSVASRASRCASSSSCRSTPTGTG